MKVVCTGEKLKNAIILCERITGKNLTLPVLGALLLIASGKTLKIRATNLSLGIEFEIPAKIETEGVVLVKGEVIAGIMGTLADSDEITLTLENENLVLKTKKSKLLVKCLPTEDFPTLPAVQEGIVFSIDPKVLVQGIKAVSFAAAVSDIKPEISAIFIYTDAEHIVFVATDSFRLAEKKLKLKQVPEITQLLIPFKNIAEITRVLEGVNGEVRIEFTKNLISFSGGGIFLTSRLVDGIFPDYRQIIPKEWKTQCVLLKQDLSNTLRLSTIFADKFQQTMFSLNPAEKTVSVTSQNADVGENTSSVDAVLKGEPIEVTINLRYFLDAFQALSGDSIAIELTQPNRALVVKSVSDHNFLYLLMPLNR
ncbi:MAG TPA: DNA polymerase III subunit beta [Candidatus Paceibacterota bacterium]|nr:DNA polymerase III subunit beta [Candidatus Paceibacterota bacterium]